MDLNSEVIDSNSSGFTLVEALIATVILAVGLLGVATMISKSTIQDARAYYSTHASLMVEEFLENATRMQYKKSNYSNMTGFSSNMTIDGVQYSTVCVLLNDVPMDRCKEMRCTISWNNKGMATGTEYVYVYAPKY